MKKSTLSNISSLAFMIISLVLFYFIWSGSVQGEDITIYENTETYTPVDISGMKSQAVKIINSYENNSNIPIPTPVGKMGKSNPFADPE